MGLGRAATAASAAAVLAAVAVFFRRLSGRAYDGLSSIISFSSKVIAASRAVETGEEHPLVTDPLAEGMAGEAAVATSRRRAAPAPEGSERRYKVGKMAIRTRWFDDQIEAALGMPVSTHIPACLRAAGAPSTVDLGAYVWTHPQGQEPRQLVMLGAGMDSRPWRMKLPADLRWLEVDQPDVVEAKRKLLRQLAAEVPPALGEDSEPSTPTGARTSSGLARHLSIDKTRFPLRCGSWSAVPADLSNPSWADALLGAGFDPEKPTVWVAEGLLMYLQAPKVEALLQKIAELSPEGSAFVAMSLTESAMQRMKARQAGNPNTSLLSTWVFGCPDDPSEFLAKNGWRLQMLTDRARQAAALGIDPELCAFGAAASSNGSADGRADGSLFLAMDFKGQQLAETLAMYIVLAFAALGFLVGYLRQEFGEMMGVFTGGVVLAGMLTVPDWPAFNKHPVAWLPPREQPGGGAQQRRGGGSKAAKKKASWSNLWGAF
ncbi:hypothetical protein ABPG75_004743 [Micractinium tetrahymenae]